jgi:hypothetical protein
MSNPNIGPLAFLPYAQLLELKILPDNRRKGIIVAAFVDLLLLEMVVFNANEKEFIIPLSFFKPSGNGVYPDFHKIEIIDYGHTIKLGDYEAASSAILYEADHEYKAYCDANRMTN